MPAPDNDAAAPKSHSRKRPGGFTERSLIAALSSGDGFRILLQPQFHLHTGEIVGAEALARWRHGENQDIPPAEFLPILDRLGLESTLFELVCERIRALLCELQHHAIQCPISVNASAELLSTGAILRRLEDRLQSVELPNRLLKIEVTEDKTAPDLPALARELSRMKARGFEISIDDFGVGRSSLKRLVSLPFTELKIDRMFVQAMAHCPASLAVVHTSLELGRRMELRVVAEGVETDEQARMLQAMGCHYGQGFGLSHPLEAPAFIARMTDGKHMKPRL
ncbi:EAL domain-containing protein [Pseudomonas citronellolis]|uniref:EAL domain-containing protein n=1 Tax=Pseudomonas citronellolis TaxID=53408 RepID=UPI002D785F49|nr:EAL domain-containing protein [Pseudomonas citronellolis]WRT82520.1 EAL domain-containing protein [Pseudomonas citronellolis]